MSDKTTDQMFWELDAFIKCSVFGPPEDGILAAHDTLNRLRTRLATAEAEVTRLRGRVRLEDHEAALTERNTFLAERDAARAEVERLTQELSECLEQRGHDRYDAAEGG